MIHGCFTNKKIGKSMFVTFVYGLHTVDTRRPLWALLKKISDTMQTEWCVLGDFNVILSSEDMLHGSKGH